MYQQQSILQYWNALRGSSSSRRGGARCTGRSGSSWQKEEDWDLGNASITRVWGNNLGLDAAKAAHGRLWWVRGDGSCMIYATQERDKYLDPDERRKYNSETREAIWGSIEGALQQLNGEDKTALVSALGADIQAKLVHGGEHAKAAKPWLTGGEADGESAMDAERIIRSERRHAEPDWLARRGTVGGTPKAQAEAGESNRRHCRWQDQVEGVLPWRRPLRMV